MLYYYNFKQEIDDKMRIATLSIKVGETLLYFFKYLDNVFKLR